MIVPKILFKDNTSYILLKELKGGGYLYKESITGKNYVFSESEIKPPIHIKTRNMRQDRGDEER